MIRTLTLSAAIVAAGGGLLADFSPRRTVYRCEGAWQQGSAFVTERLVAVVDDDRWPLLADLTSSAGSMSIVARDGTYFGYGSMRTDGSRWYIYSGSEHMGMLSAHSGRMLLDGERGLFQGDCVATLAGSFSDRRSDGVRR